MPTEYYTDDALTAQVTGVVEDKNHHEFKPIVAHDIQIGSFFKLCTDKDGEPKAGTGPAVTVQKVSATNRVFSSADYLLIVDAHAYNGSTLHQQKAMLHHGLMKINVDEKDGHVKKAIRKPDIVEFNATITRYGTYTDDLLGLKQVFEEVVPTISSLPKSAKSK